MRSCIRRGGKKTEVHQKGELSIFCIPYDARGCCYFPVSTVDFRILYKIQHYIAVLLILISYSFSESPVNTKTTRVLGNLVLENIPVIPVKLKQRMEQYNNVRSAGFQDWDPHTSGMLITTRFGNTTQIHHVAQPGASRKQITFFKEPVYFAQYCAGSTKKGFLFLKDTGGDENYQIFYYDIQSGSYTILSDGTAKYGALSCSNTSDRFAYYTTKRNGIDFDIYISSVNNSKKQERIIKGDGLWAPGNWSQDDKYIIVENFLSSTEAYVFIYDIEKKRLIPVNKKKKNVAYGGIVWTPENKGLFLTATDNSEFLSLQYYDIKSKKMRLLTKNLHWNIIDHTISRDGKQVAFVTNEHGLSNLYMLNTETMQYKKMDGIPKGRIYGLSYNTDDSKLSLVINAPDSPADVYSLSMKDKELTRWTNSEVGGLNTDDFVVPEVIYYETFDTVGNKPRKIPALIYKPHKRKGPFPVLIIIHGGPESQFWPMYKSSIQYYANELGVAVVAPNVRGSAGYGKSYMELDNGYKRKDALRDIGSLLKWIEKQPDFNKNRVGVYGGSYGGYMSLASMVNYNNKFACAIDLYGISNFVSFLENTKEYRRDLRRVEYGDERDPKMRSFLESISPVNDCRKITKPLFVLQGANDPRVPQSESEQMVSKIRENNKDVWYLLAKDEGHGFGKKENKDFIENAIVLFLQKYLLY